MPNIHYFTVNMAPFGMANKDEVNVCCIIRKVSFATILSILLFIITEK